MSRDHTAKSYATRDHLLERGFTRDEVHSKFPPSETARFERFRDCSISFSTGWDEAQKWQVSEDERNALAAQILQGLLAGRSNSVSSPATGYIELAYEITDELIEKRGGK